MSVGTVAFSGPSGLPVIARSDVKIRRKRGRQFLEEGESDRTRTDYSYNVNRNHCRQRHHNKPVIPFQPSFSVESYVKACHDSYYCQYSHDSPYNRVRGLVHRGMSTWACVLQGYWKSESLCSHSLTMKTALLQPVRMANSDHLYTADRPMTVTGHQAAPKATCLIAKS